MSTTTLVLTLTHHTCGKCGIAFGLESTHHANLMESHETFYCPNGHPRAFTGQTEKERRIAELERQTKALASARDYWSNRTASATREVEQTTRRLNGYKGVVTRMKRRAVAGRCPCCSHTFKDVKRHMASQHPDWNPDVEANHRSGSTT